MAIPFLVAHRGYASKYPENSLEGLEAALQAGACFVEFDVQLTSDCVPVLLHDADLRRTGDRAERVLEMTLEELLEVEINQSQLFGDRFAGVRVPTLRGALELVAQRPRARAFVEVKPEGIRHFGVERVLERIMVDLAAAPSQYILISSVIEFVARARRSGRAEIGFVLSDWSETARRELQELQPDYVLCNLKRIPVETRLWSGPWKWVVYEVVSPSLAHELAGRGADFIETMAIGEMLADSLLGTRSCHD